MGHTERMGCQQRCSQVPKLPVRLVQLARRTEHQRTVAAEAVAGEREREQELGQLMLLTWTELVHSLQAIRCIKLPSLMAIAGLPIPEPASQVTGAGKSRISHIYCLCIPAWHMIACTLRPADRAGS